MTYAGDGEKPVLKKAAEMDGKLVLEITAEIDGKLDTWTSQAMFEQQGRQTTQVMEAGPGSWTGGCTYGFC